MEVEDITDTNLIEVQNISVQYILDCINYSEDVTLIEVSNDTLIGYYEEDDYRFDFEIELIKFGNSIVDMKFNGTPLMFKNGESYFTKDISRGDINDLPTSIQIFKISKLSVPVFNKIITLSEFPKFLTDRKIADGLFDVTFKEGESLVLSSIINGCSLIDFWINESCMYARLRYDGSDFVIYSSEELSLIGTLPPFLDYGLEV